MFALADCNNFFVSCERLFRPNLNGKPVIVLSNNDGCAIARSNEAKALGIKMGDPLFKIMPIVKRENITVFSSNYALYGDISNRVRATLREFAEEIEVYSIDEAFINLSGMRVADFAGFARDISKRCMKNVGIPVSVGVSKTRTLSKIASKLCKQYPKLQGGCYMHRDEDIEKVLRRFPVDDVWGIGRRTYKKLQTMDINTAWDYRSIPQSDISYLFGINGVRTWNELHGIPSIDIFQTLDPRLTISQSRSFAKEIYDKILLKEQLSNFAFTVSEKLRNQDSLCREITIYAVTNRFKEQEPQSCISTIIQIPDGTNSSRHIVSAVSYALDTIFLSGLGYKKAGVIASKLTSTHNLQMSLFDMGENDKEKKLMQAMDLINSKNGNYSVRLAVQGDCKPVSLSKYRSPDYTTKWSDIPSVTIH